ncbi:MAG: hypothetical protein EOO40_06715 [Deltaproteobacteria bacterium]|nr:MAG: hypothetical protein EOO40_06715 [Deltaproteobacteria bacterium]
MEDISNREKKVRAAANLRGPLSNFDHLPLTLQRRILADLGLADLDRLAKTSRGLRDLADSDPRWGTLSGELSGQGCVPPRPRLEVKRRIAALEMGIEAHATLGRLLESARGESSLSAMLASEGFVAAQLRDWEDNEAAQGDDFAAVAAEHVGHYIGQAHQHRKAELRLICACNLPPCIAQLTSLQRLILNSCSLTHLPDAVGGMARLELLNLSNCTSLTELPSSVNGLKGLRHLILGNCPSLQQMPDIIGELTGLESLDLMGCGLSHLPDTLGNLTGLTKVSLCCANLTSLPNTIGALANLHQLRYECHAVSVLPDSLSALTGLKKFQLDGCHGLTHLPEELGNLSNLHFLSLRACRSLRYLPESIGTLPSLTRLRLSECPGLHHSFTFADLSRPGLKITS